MKRIGLTGLLSLFLLTLAWAKSPVHTHVPQDDGSKYGQDSVKCIMNLSLYREVYKQWKANDYKGASIKEAFKPWSWVFNNCPRGSENTYVEGVNIMEYRINNEPDKERKNLFIDTLEMIYDNRIKYFPNHYKTNKPQEGEILGRKGSDMYKYRPSNIEGAYQTLKKSVSLEGDESSGAVMVYYFRATIKMAKSGLIDSAVIVDTYDEIAGIIDRNIKYYKEKGKTKNVEIYENYKGNIESSFEPFATCDDLIRIYAKKYNETPEDPELLKKITDLLDKNKCIESPLYLDASRSLHAIEPSPESAYLIGKILLKDKKVDEATPYLEEATAMEDEEKRSQAYLYLAEAYRAAGNKSKSRQMALKVIELDPNNGTPYIIIGDLYAESAKQCGDTDLTKRVAYWAAVDKYYQAKKADPSMEETANSRIRTYSAYFPAAEELFFNTLNEGDPYKVECWINETTVIRARK